MTIKAKIRIEDLYTVDALTESQGQFFSMFHKKPAFLLHGLAGTGKTFIALYKALETTLDKGTFYERVLIIRSAVPVRDIGALPGDLEEKSAVYQEPYRILCNALVNKPQAYERLREQKTLEFMLSSYIKGLTFDRAIIIVDEVQNMSYQELYNIITRVGEDSRIIFCGDTRQNDLYTKSGLDKFIRVLDNMSSVCHIEFNVEDIVRSGLVKEFIIAESEFR
jgi:phosphate starvation-inducible PhoH-like protein/PhoH-like ATPase